jgi:hypothetical protein
VRRVNTGRRSKKKGGIAKFLKRIYNEAGQKQEVKAESKKETDSERKNPTSIFGMIMEDRKSGM